MPKAIRVRADNVDAIIAYAGLRRLNLDYLKDTMKYNAELYGEDTFVITDGSQERNNVTFTEMTETDFSTHWKFIKAENPNLFVPITHR
jgi:hypothetical protein